MCHFSEIPCFTLFPPFSRFEQYISLCSQIQIMSFVFLLIKSRMFSGPWEVVTVSGAGHLCRHYTVPGRAIRDNILISTD